MCERSAKEDDFCAHLLKFPLGSPSSSSTYCAHMCDDDDDDRNQHD